MQPIYLTAIEIKEITLKKRFRAQITVLVKLGIECKIRPNGSPLVSRLAFERAMGGVPENAYDQQEIPDFDSLLNVT